MGFIGGDDEKPKRGSRDEEVVVRTSDTDRSSEASLEEDVQETLSDSRGTDSSEVDLEDIHQQNQRMIEVLERIHSELQSQDKSQKRKSYRANSASSSTGAGSRDDRRSKRDEGDPEAGIDLPGGGL